MADADDPDDQRADGQHVGQDDGQDGVAVRRAALRERDRWVGLEAALQSAEARAGRLAIELEVARERLGRKNRRIAELTGRTEGRGQDDAEPRSRGPRRWGSMRRTPTR